MINSDRVLVTMSYPDRKPKFCRFIDFHMDLMIDPTSYRGDIHVGWEVGDHLGSSMREGSKFNLENRPWRVIEHEPWAMTTLCAPDNVWAFIRVIQTKAMRHIWYPFRSWFLRTGKKRGLFTIDNDGLTVFQWNQVKLLGRWRL